MKNEISTDRLTIKISPDTGSDRIFSISERDSSDIIGEVKLTEVDRANKSARVDIHVNEKYLGHGYASEALRAVNSYAINKLELIRVWSNCPDTNPAGIRVMQKSGMNYEGTSEAGVLIDDEPVAVQNYVFVKKCLDFDMPSSIQLETDRLILRTPVYADTKRIIDPINDKEISDNSAHINYPFTEKDAWDWYMHQAWVGSTWGHLTLVTILQETDELIGSCWLRSDHHHHKAGIAYWIGRKFWNQGYATEQCERLMKHAYEDLDVRRLTATVIIGNDASDRVVEKLNFMLESTTYKEWWRGDHPIDCRHYVLYRDQWEQNQKADAQSR